MLKRFTVSHFKGFRDRIELNLSNPREYEFNGYAIADGTVKDLIIFGKNGSGKSNIGFALFDIINHLTQKHKAASHYMYSVYAGTPDSEMEFEYSFDFSGTAVDYIYSKDSKGRLTREKLVTDGRTVFYRNGSLSIDRSEFPITDETVSRLESNSNSISIINYLVSSYPIPEDHYLNRLKGFAESMLWFRCLEDRGFMGLHTDPTDIEAFIIDNGLTEDLREFLKETSEQTYQFKIPDKEDKRIYCLMDGQTVPFCSVYSTGTSSLLLLYYWIKNMDDASLVFIDEFDAFYHFRLSEAVCRRLFSLPCQVILTSHDTFLMSNSLLRPDCNFIIDGQRIKPLCDCTEKELRWGHNIEKLYRGGAFEP